MYLTTWLDKSTHFCLYLSDEMESGEQPSAEVSAAFTHELSENTDIIATTILLPFCFQTYKYTAALVK